MNGATHIEKIYRVWSDKAQERIAVRIQFCIEEAAGCRFIQLGGREEWI